MKLTTGYKKPIDSSGQILMSDGSHKNISDIINDYGAMSISPVITFSNPISGDLLGNATTADRLKNARTINGISFDGTSNITITAEANGGRADVADELSTDAGSLLNPVYFYSGLPVACTGNAIPFLSGGTAIAAKSASETRDGDTKAYTYYYPNKWYFNTKLTPTNGMIIAIELPNGGHDYGDFLSLDNGTTYYPVVRNGTGRLTTHYGSGMHILLSFDSDGSAASMYKLVGSTGRVTVSGGVWRLLNEYDSGNTDVRYELKQYYYRNTVASDGKIVRYSLCMNTPDGKITSLTLTDNSYGSTSKTMYSGNLLLGKVYYWGHTDNYNAGAVITRDYLMFELVGDFVDYRYTFNCGTTLTKNRELYIVGTIDSSSGYFKLDTTQPWSCSLPTSEDNKIYIKVGIVYPDTNPYRGTLEAVNTAYWYKNGRIQEYSLPAWVDNKSSSTEYNLAFKSGYNIGYASNSSLTYSPSNYTLTLSNTNGSGIFLLGDINEYLSNVTSTKGALLSYTNNTDYTFSFYTPTDINNQIGSGGFNIYSSSGWNVFKIYLDGSILSCSNNDNNEDLWSIGADGVFDGKAEKDGDGNTISTTYLKKTGGTVSGNTTFSSTVSIDSLTAGNLTVTGNSALGTISSGTWNGSTIGSTYLPTATSSAIGAVKVGSTLSSTSGYTACPIYNGVIYYKNEAHTSDSYTGTVTGIKIDSTTYSPSSGTVTLPAGINKYNSSWYSRIPMIDANGVLEIGPYIDFHSSGTGTSDYSVRLLCTADSLIAVTLPSSSGTLALVGDNNHTHGEATLTWGGANLCGGVSVIDAAIDNALGQNRSAFINPAAITITYSNSTTYSSIGTSNINNLTSLEISDTTKIMLMTSSLYQGIPIGNTTSISSSNYNKLCTVVKIYTGHSNESTCYLYTSLKKILINFCFSGHGCYLDVYGSKIGSSSTIELLKSDILLGGWPGWNSIDMSSIGNFGGSTSQTSLYDTLYLKFYVKSFNSSFADQYPTIGNIHLVGTDVWYPPSNMATDGHLYSYDASLNATFPADVTAVAFYASSDIRYKSIIENINSTSLDIANLPIFKYTWKNKEDNILHIGSSALAVEEILPELVTEKEDFKSLDYATLGTIGSIIACREIELLKKRIKELEDKLNG